MKQMKRNKIFKNKNKFEKYIGQSSATPLVFLICCLLLKLVLHSSI